MTPTSSSTRTATIRPFTSARSTLESLANGPREWAVPWPCAHEFLAIVTHSRIYRTPTPPATALAQLRALHALSNLAFIGEIDEHLQHLEPLALDARNVGLDPQPPPRSKAREAGHEFAA